MKEQIKNSTNSLKDALHQAAAEQGYDMTFAMDNEHGHVTLKFRPAPSKQALWLMNAPLKAVFQLAHNDARFAKWFSRNMGKMRAMAMAEKRKMQAQSEVIDTVILIKDYV